MSRTPPTTEEPPASLSPWKRFRYRLEWLACRLIAWFIPLLSRENSVALADAVGALAYRFDARGRRVALANLQCAFGERYTVAERKAIAEQSYKTFVRTMVDLFWASNLTSENWREYIQFEGEEIVQEDGAATVVLCVHWGNFEWGGLSAGFQGRPSTIVAETFKNPLLTEIFREARSVSGNLLIPQENSMIRLLKTVKKRGGTGMLADLTLPPSQAAVPIEAFGMKMSVSCLHAVLATRGGAVLLPGRNEPLPDGRTRTIIEHRLQYPAGASLQEITQACWDIFEEQIRRQPEHWMWFYKHWRYRPKDAPAGSYPFYANVSSKFERLLHQPPQSVGKSRNQRPPATPEG